MNNYTSQEIIDFLTSSDKEFSLVYRLPIQNDCNIDVYGDIDELLDTLDSLIASDDILDGVYVFHDQNLIVVG